MEQDYRLAEGEYRFACLVWANEPLGSGQLVALANEALGWKKSTTYTVLKKLCERGILHNANGTVTALVKQAQVQQEESAAVNTTKLIIPAAAVIPNLLKVSTKGLPIVPSWFQG